MFRAEKENREIVDYLLGKGADIHKSRTDGAISLLHVACEKGFKNLVELFLKSNVDVDQVRRDTGGTPLHSA